LGYPIILEHPGMWRPAENWVLQCTPAHMGATTFCKHFNNAPGPDVWFPGWISARCQSGLRTPARLVSGTIPEPKACHKFAETAPAQYSKRRGWSPTTRDQNCAPRPMTADGEGAEEAAAVGRRQAFHLQIYMPAIGPAVSRFPRGVHGPGGSARTGSCQGRSETPAAPPSGSHRLVVRCLFACLRAAVATTSGQPRVNSGGYLPAARATLWLRPFTETVPQHL
jgi:hypothetical protein